MPLYYQLKEILLEYITNQHTDLDVPIPPEVEISAHFEISRPTVRQAINELVVEGYLFRVKGKGTFVSKSKINQSFLRELDSFNNEMREKGLHPSTKVLRATVINSDRKISEALQIPFGMEVIELRRLRFANDEPIVSVITYLPYEKCKAILSKDLENESLYQILQDECGYILKKAVRQLEASLVGEYEAELLRVERGAPIQYIKTITYLSDDTPIEYSLAKYRGDRNKFTFEIER